MAGSSGKRSAESASGGPTGSAPDPYQEMSPAGESAAAEGRGGGEVVRPRHSTHNSCRHLFEEGHH